MKNIVTYILLLCFSLQNLYSQSCSTTLLNEPFDTPAIAGANAAVLYGNGGSNHNSSYILSGSYFGWFNIINGISNVDVYTANMTGLAIGCPVTASIMIRESFGGTNVDLNLVDDNGIILSTINLNLTSTYQLITLTAPATTTGLSYVVHFNGTGGGGLDIAMENLVISQDCNNIPDIQPTGNQCLTGNSFIFDGTNSTALLGITSYTWDFDDSSPLGTNATETHTYASAGAYTVTLATSDGSCTNTASITINVIQDLSAVITPTGPFCTGDPSINLVGADPGGNWTGTGITNALLGTFDPTLAGAGNHVVTYDIAGMCGDTQTTTLVVNNANDATITPITDTLCQVDTPFNLTAISAGGTWSGNGITNAVNGTFDPSSAGPGLHTVTYSIPAPCPDIQTTIIRVIDFWDITITPVAPFCEDDLPLASMSAVTPGGTWSGNGITDPVLGTFDPSIAGPGVHIITYNLAGGCGGTSTESILVNAVPVMDFSIDNSSICLPTLVNFSDNSALPSTGCLWDFGDGNTSTDCGTTTHTYLSAGCFDVTLTLTNAAACSNTATTPSMVCVYDYPIANFSFGPTPVFVSNIVYFQNTSQGADLYEWDFGNLATSADFEPTFTFPVDAAIGDHEICLIASNTQGCADTICSTLTIENTFSIYTPNTFTPNNDGINDLFQPILIGDYIDYTFYIFDRWGELIFTSTSADDYWDGIHNSLPCQEGVYVWKIDVRDAISGEYKELNGHVTLLK